MDSSEAPRGFPETRCSIVRDLSEGDSERRDRAFASLVEAYWKPVYTYLRLYKHIARDDAEDLTQGFFAYAFEKRTLARFDSERAKFRTWVRTCLDGYVANERKAADRLKRGGAYQHVSLDFETAEGELRQREIAAADDVEAFFHREWMRELLASAIDDMREASAREGRELEFKIFARYDIEGPDVDGALTYAELGRELGVSASKVTNALRAMRQRLRERVLRRLDGTSASETEFKEDVRTLFGGNS